MSTLIVVGTVQSRVKQATSRLSSRLNSVDNKLVERLTMNDEREPQKSFMKIRYSWAAITFHNSELGASALCFRYRFRTAAGCYV